MCNQMRSNRLILRLEKKISYIKHFRNPISFTKQCICRHIYSLIYILIVMPDNLLAVWH